MPKTVADENKKAILMGKLQKSVLASLGEEELRCLSDSSKIVVYEKGDAIITEGSYDDRIFCLISGQVDVRKNKDISIAVLRNPGDLFGELGVIDGGARSASVKAMLHNTVCLSIDAARLNNAKDVSKEKILDKLFTHVLADRLRATTDELASIQTKLQQVEKRLTETQKELAEMVRIKNENKVYNRLLESIEKQILRARSEITP